MRYSLVLAFLLSGCINPRFYNPEELAEYTNCDPHKIAYWITGRMNYLEQGPFWDDAEICMRHETGDCKCAAKIAEETLLHCPKTVAWTEVITHKTKGVKHAIAFFMKEDGRIGYIDWGRAVIAPKYMTVDKLIQDLPGGPWQGKEYHTNGDLIELSN